MKKDEAHIYERGGTDSLSDEELLDALIEASGDFASSSDRRLRFVFRARIRICRAEILVRLRNRREYGKKLSAYFDWLEQKLGYIPADVQRLSDFCWFADSADRARMGAWINTLNSLRRFSRISISERNLLIKALKEQKR